LTFPLGTVSDTIAVIVLGDAVLEGNETVLMRIVGVMSGTPTNTLAFGTIANDERTTFQSVNGGFATYGSTIPPSWCDYDKDGWLDLPLQHAQSPYVFQEIPGFRTLLAAGEYHGGAWCDYDKDSWPDLVMTPYVSNVETHVLLLHNQGNGTFANIAPSLGMDTQGFGETAVWADFDADGWPDLFLPFYSHAAPFRSFLYRNNGNGTFTERAVQAGVDLPGLPFEFRPEGASAADWDGNGTIDFYCAHHLFLNDGAGNFHDVRAQVGLPQIFEEGAKFIDYDNDGDLDLYLRPFASPRLFRNDGGTYTEVTAQAGLVPVDIYYGDNWADVDNDGDLDLLLLMDQAPARLMLNRGDGTFVRDTSFEALNIRPDLSAFGDLNHDHDLDFVVGASTKQLYVNNLQSMTSAGWLDLRVTVLDAQGFPIVFGATVQLRCLEDPPGRVQTRIVDGGSGYLTQSEYPVHFGGVANGHYALSVVFPSAAGSKVVVDSLDNAVLGHLDAATLPSRDIVIYRDGRVQFTLGPTEVPDYGWRLTSENPLGLAVPSPAFARTIWPFKLVAHGRTTIELYDLAGRRIRREDLGELPAGPHRWVWDLTDDHGRPAATGLYLARLMRDGQAIGSGRVMVTR
jgi:hypothetical protein